MLLVVDDDPDLPAVPTRHPDDTGCQNGKRAAGREPGAVNKDRKAIVDAAIANMGDTDLTDDDLKAIATFAARQPNEFRVDLKLAPLGGVMAFLAGREPSRQMPVFGIGRAATGHFTLATLREAGDGIMETFVCVDRDAMFGVIQAILFEGACKAAGAFNPSAEHGRLH